MQAMGPPALTPAQDADSHDLIVESDLLHLAIVGKNFGMVGFAGQMLPTARNTGYQIAVMQHLQMSGLGLNF